MKAKAPGQWWDRSWSPVTGCTPAGEGCRNCHALRKMRRHLPVLRGKGNADVPCTTVLTHPERLGWPLRWRQPQIVLTPMMGDLFHDDVTETFRNAVVDAMIAAHRHTFVLLTKRPVAASQMFQGSESWSLPPSNVIIMASVWDQNSASAACDAFKYLAPSRRWGLHAEPLLGPIDMRRAQPQTAARLPTWIVVGGENGPGARPMQPLWALELLERCRIARVPLWFKGWGSAPADFVVPTGAQRISLERSREVPW